ncbi:NERD domain-containing protein [Pseudomonas sp. ACM7]|uniref:NERD domain-containing protein n=1 Tax=Pseudomonas sp. ACM7 TaxID=2052956 RepID=UPI0010129AA5|nr:NERD domain-containing protein [Pseudomonas sp. ACM7]QAY91502.1 hypothetical protein CUN63_16935 [Pseudomonas sp. ACM7]
MSVDREAICKKLQNALVNFELKLALEAISALSSEDVNTQFLAQLAQPGAFKIRGVQDKRNEFYKQLLSEKDLIDRHAEVHQFAQDQFNKILSIEEDFSRIRSTLIRCDAAKLSTNIQFWSQVIWAAQALKHVHDESERSVMELSSNNAPFAMPEMVVIKDKDGQEINTDGALSSIIENLSLTLKMLSHENKWNFEGKLIGPLKIEVSEEHLFKATSIKMLASAWNSLEDIANRTLLFGGEITSFEEAGVPEGINGKDFFDQYSDCKVFHRTPTEIEKLDFLANRRLHSWTMQNVAKMMYGTTLHALVKTGKEPVPSLSAVRFISMDEAITVASLSEILAFDVITDYEKYHGLTLREWVRGYSSLRLLAERKYSDVSLVTIDRAVLKKELCACKIPESSVFDLIKHLTFGLNCHDLFDSPLIFSEGHKFSFFPQAILSCNLINVILSKLGSLDVEFDKKRKGKAKEAKGSSKKSKIASKKGDGFEKKIVSFFKGLHYECVSTSFNIDDAQYQYDALLILDDTLFLIECKNTSISGNHAVQASRYFEFISKTIGQIKRLERALKARPEIVESLFGRKLSELTIVPLILNSLTYSCPPIEGVYISDNSALSKFFKESTISQFSYMNGVKTPSKNTHRLWSGERPTSQELLDYLAWPPQLEIMAKHMSYHKHPHYTSESSMFYSGVLDIDEVAMMKAKMEAAEV